MHRTDDKALRERLETLYERYNRRKYVHPDPLEFLYRYPELRDREVAGMVAASLAYGRVAQIIRSVSAVLDIMGDSPHGFVSSATDAQINSALDGFVHRFATGPGMARLLVGMRGVLERYGSLHGAFQRQLHPQHESVLPALNSFCRLLAEAAGADLGHLLPLPDRGSACKRMNLFLRWMVRRDAVDPGGWDDVPVAGLIVPLDVHMHRVGQQLGFTVRKQANMKTALEITAGFKRLVPRDPVRYDFALTRPGIWGEANGHALRI